MAKTQAKTKGMGNETKEELLGYLRSMYEIRCFEDRVYELIRGGSIKGASHLYAGQEAVAVGAIAAISESDIITSTHRGHGHCGAIGNKWAKSDTERQDHWNKMMAELMGKATGYCKGRGGSMHIADVEKGNMGATGVVGGNLPVCIGAAMAEKMKGSGAVTLCFFGDGASNEGAFHESLNWATVMMNGLPVVYICENNLYGMSNPWFDRSVKMDHHAGSVKHVSDRAEGYGMPGIIVDGTDVIDVREKIAIAVERARKEGKPSLVECKTYRYYGHSLSDQKAYRSKEEEEDFRSNKDPIGVLSKKLLANGIATEAEIEAIKNKAQASIETATDFAKNSAYPDVAELMDYIYVDKDPKELAKEIEDEKKLLAKVRPIEDEIRKVAREVANKSPKGAMPKLNKEQTTQFENKFGMPIKPYNEALIQAHDEEMARDKMVFVMGEDVGLYGGAYAATRGLYPKYGENRVMDTPIAEQAIAGSAAGAAMRGARPVAEFQYVDFVTLASDQIIHTAAYNRYMFGGKTKVPVVYRSQGGVGRCIAAHHSGSFESWFMHVPGLYVIMPSTPYDAKGLLKAAIRDDNPVMFLEHKLLYSGVTGPVPAEDYIIPIGIADIKKPGKDVTMVSYSQMLHPTLDAAWTLLEDHGVDAEVIDPRTLKPLDVKTIAESVRKTGRLVCVTEGYPICGVASEIARQVMEYKFENGRTGWDYMDAKPEILSAKDCPIPMSEPLEDAVVPSRNDIVNQTLALLKR